MRLTKTKTSSKTYPFAQVFEDLDLNQRLMMKPLLIPDDFDGDGLSCGVIAALQYLTKRALSKNVHNLVSIGQVITIDDNVVATLVVVPIIARRVLWSCLSLLAVSTNIVDFVEVEDLRLFVWRKVRSLTTS